MHDIWRMHGDMLSQLKGTDHVIELLGMSQCVWNGAIWSAIVVMPFVQQLSCKDDLRLFGQVGHACSKLHVVCASSHF